MNALYLILGTLLITTITATNWLQWGTTRENRPSNARGRVTALRLPRQHPRSRNVVFSRQVAHDCWLLLLVGKLNQDWENDREYSEAEGEKGHVIADVAAMHFL